MAFDFPSSPTVGQLFSSGGVVFQWDGVTWLMQAPAGWGLATMVIATDPPSNPVAGQLWWESDSGRLFAFYIDPGGPPGQWVQISGPLAPTAFLKRTVFTASSTAFQFDSAANFADIEVQGAGAAGGGTTGSSGAGLARAGGGGGGGGYARKLIQITDTVRSATKTITVGSGGNGAVGNGAAGGNSSYSDTVNALTGNGGAGGIAGAAGSSLNFCLGGLGGSAAGGDVIVVGQPGHAGHAFGTTIVQVAANCAAQAGNGGAGFFGGGGQGVSANVTSANTSQQGGNAPNGGGGGGGGFMVNAAGSNAAGGSGGDGRVVITEYR